MYNPIRYIKIGNDYFFEEDDDINTKKNNLGINIRHMEIDDIGVVFHLGETLFTAHDVPILHRTWDAYEVADYFTSDPDYCLVTETNGKIVGFILANTIEKLGNI